MPCNLGFHTGCMLTAVMLMLVCWITKNKKLLRLKWKQIINYGNKSYFSVVKSYWLRKLFSHPNKILSIELLLTIGDVYLNFHDLEEQFWYYGLRNWLRSHAYIYESSGPALLPFQNRSQFNVSSYTSSMLY